MRRGRLLWAGVATAAFTIPLIWTLLSPGAPDRQSTPIEPKVPAESLSISFSRISPWGDERIHEMSLFSPVPVDILRHAEIHITFSQSDKTFRHPATGRLEVVGTSCVYEMQADAEINNGIPQPFVRTGPCLVQQGRPTGELALTVKMGGPGDLGLFTLPLPPELRSGGMIYIGERRDGIPDPPPTIMGVFVDDMPALGLRRVNLLSYMWTGSVKPLAVWLVVAGGSFLIFVGALVFPISERTETGWISRAAPRAAAGGFCMATGLALLYAVAIPPLQAADETPFAGAYGLVTAQPRFLPEIRQLALDTHFERIRFLATERFRPRDVGKPFAYVTKFDELDMATRSSLTTYLWQGMGRWLPRRSAAATFAMVRGVHAVLFGLAVAAAAGLLTASARVSYPQFLCFPFLFVPTLPFFGMQFSETAVLTSAVVMLAAGLAILVVDDRNSHYMGLSIGLGAAAILLTTRSALPMSALVAVMLLMRALLGSRGGNHPVREAAVFWGGLSLAAACFFTVASVPHLTRILETGAQITARFPDLWAPARWLLDHPWVVGVAGVPLAGWLLEATTALGRRRLQRVLAPAATAVAPVVCFAIVAAIAASLLGSWWWDYPDVENIQSPLAPGLGRYTGQVVIGMASMFRLRHSSTFLSDSFWAGFGWLDTMPGDWFVAVLVTLTAASLMTFLGITAVTRNVRRSVWLVAFIGGSLVTFAFYAFSSKQIVSNLHGRYLMPWFVVALAVFWIPVAMAGDQLASRTMTGAGPARPAALLALILSVHAYCLCFILQRYF